MRAAGGVVARALAASLAFAPGTGAAAPRPLRYDLGVDLALTGAALVLTAALSAPGMAAPHCRICAPGRLDAGLQADLVWHDPAPARSASDLLANAALPVLALGGTALSAWAAGAPREGLVDALVIVEAASIASTLELATKDAAGRRRPGATSDGPQANRSFYSGHTSLAFSLATSSGTVASLRGYPAAPWIWAGGLVLASGVGYLRVAGNAHWSTDVLAGAVVGGLTGFAVPWLLHRPGPGHLVLVPAPGGMALLF